MPELDASTRTHRTPPELPTGARETRIDPAHPRHDEAVGDGAAIRESLLGAPDAAGLGWEGESPYEAVDLLRQTRLQGQQLAAHLQSRQVDLDRRERLLHGQIAELDQMARQNRLWLRERHAEFAEREAALAAQQAELDRRQKELADGEVRQSEWSARQFQDLQSRRQGLDLREAALSDAEAQFAKREELLSAGERAAADAALAVEELSSELERRTRSFEARRAAVERIIGKFLRGERPDVARPVRRVEKGPAESEWESVSGPGQRSLFERDEFDDLAELLGQWHDRREQLIAAERSLVAAQHEVDEIRQSLLAERKEFFRRRGTEQKEWEAARARADSEWRNRLEQLRLAHDQVELRMAAVEQMRGELAIVQREAIESRLIAEELMGELRGARPAGQIAHAVSKSRAKLADFYRLQAEDLGAQRRELESLLSQLPEKQAGLEQRRVAWEQWLTARTVEVERAAARLADRERELEEQRSRLADQERVWDLERQSNLRQFRALLATGEQDLDPMAEGLVPGA